MILGGVHPLMMASGHLDPYWDNVVLLLHFDGVDGSTVIVDSSKSAIAITCEAEAKLSTAQYKYGTASLLLDGTLDRLSISSSALVIGTEDFTIECYARTDSADANDGFFQLSDTAGGLKTSTTNTLSVALGSNLVFVTSANNFSAEIYLFILVDW